MLIRKFSPAVLLLALLSGATTQLTAQPRVDARNMYERVMAVVPLVGKGTFDDPKRPMYAPTPYPSHERQQPTKELVILMSDG